MTSGVAKADATEQKERVNFPRGRNRDRLRKKSALGELSQDGQEKQEFPLKRFDSSNFKRILSATL